MTVPEVTVTVTGPPGPERQSLCYVVHRALLSADLPVACAEPMPFNYAAVLAEYRNGLNDAGRRVRVHTADAYDPTTRVTAMLVRASHEELTFAVVTARRTDAISSATQLMRAIHRSVASWVTDTEAGRLADERSATDFNIDDLTVYLDDAELLGYLREAGVFDLLVETHCNEDMTSYEYDSVLSADPNADDTE